MSQESSTSERSEVSGGSAEEAAPPRLRQNANQARQRDATTTTDDDITSAEVIDRIEQLVGVLLQDLDEEISPIMNTYDDPEAGPVHKPISKNFQLRQCRSFASITLIMNFCHNLLLSNKTTTIREVYYAHVTHFRSQRECDAAIADTAHILQVPRRALGLKASQKGWFCGDIQLVHRETGQVILDGRTLPGETGSPVSSDWLLPRAIRNFDIVTEQAKCILVVEKEGVFHRLIEDGFFVQHPCILVTAKGFPDLASRAFVHTVHTELNLPALGLCDCNPYGILVLHTYQYSERLGRDGGDRFGVPMRWVGFRPSQVNHLQRRTATTLPSQVYQALTDGDQKRLENLLERRWTNFGQDEVRIQELQDMLEDGRKLELEALNWLGMGFLSEWLGEIFDYNFSDPELRDEEQEWMEII